MNKLLGSLDEGLPHWLGTPQLQWVQWAYGIWQVVHGNALTLFVLSLPVFLWTVCCKKKVLVLAKALKDNLMPMPLEDMMQHPWKTLTIEDYYYDNKLCFLKYGEYYYYAHTEYYYYAHTDTLRELAECERVYGENVVFVEKLMPITTEVGVGKMLSQREAYEKILSSRGYHIVDFRYVAPSLLDYVDVSSKFWGVLSTIPIVLQAKSYNRLSTLFSIVLILLDLNRYWLYRIYDNIFNRFVKYVKLHIFKDRANLYLIFSLFSSRWFVSDMKESGDTIYLRPYCKLKSKTQFKIEDFEVYGDGPRMEEQCYELDIDKAHASLKQNNVVYTRATLNRDFYVPPIKLELYF